MNPSPVQPSQPNPPLPPGERDAPAYPVEPPKEDPKKTVILPA